MPNVLEIEQEEVTLTNIPTKSTENPPPDPPRRPTANFGGSFGDDWIFEVMKIVEERFNIHEKINRGELVDEISKWETSATIGAGPTVRLTNRILDHETSSLN